MYEIVKNLYLSSYQDAKKHPLSKDPKTWIVNCTKDFPMISANGMRIPVDDNGSPKAIEDMFLAFDSTIEAIERNLDAGNPVIVHCLAGQQRSPTIIAAYIMNKYNYSLTDTIEYIRKKKQDAFFYSINFIDSLQRFALFLSEKNEKPNPST